MEYLWGQKMSEYYDHNSIFMPEGHEVILNSMSKTKCKFYLDMCGECAKDGTYCVGIQECKARKKRLKELKEKEKYEYYKIIVKEIIEKEDIDYYPLARHFINNRQENAYRYLHRNQDVAKRIIEELDLNHKSEIDGLEFTSNKKFIAYLYHKEKIMKVFEYETKLRINLLSAFPEKTQKYITKNKEMLFKAMKHW